ncbi:MAG: zf-HC2 domain-containing protein [Planctomycetota bacterium]
MRTPFCRQVREHASDHRDRKLGPDAASLIDEHLRVCPDCARVYARDRALADLARARFASETRTGSAPSRLAARIKGTLVERAFAQERPRPLAERAAATGRAWARSRAAAAAAAVLLVVCAYALGRRHGGASAVRPPEDDRAPAAGLVARDEIGSRPTPREVEVAPPVRPHPEPVAPEAAPPGTGTDGAIARAISEPRPDAPAPGAAGGEVVRDARASAALLPPEIFRLVEELGALDALETALRELAEPAATEEPAEPAFELVSARTGRDSAPSSLAEALRYALRGPTDFRVELRETRRTPDGRRVIISRSAGAAISVSIAASFESR